MKLGTKVMLTFYIILVISVLISLAGYLGLSGTTLTVVLISGCTLVIVMGLLLNRSIYGSISGLTAECNRLMEATQKGKLDTRVNPAAFAGEWGELLGVMNGLMEAIVQPVNELLTVLGRVAVNDFSQKVNKEYSGVWNDLKGYTNRVITAITSVEAVTKNISNGNLSDLAMLKKIERRSDNDKLIPAYIQMMEAIQNLVADTELLEQAAIDGKLDTRVEIARHEGEYRKVIDGFNKTLDAVIGPLNMAAKYVEQIAKGDIPPKITDSCNGDFNEIKNNLNCCIDSINGLLDEANNLIQAVREGKLETRGNAAEFAGDWGKLLGGINGLMEAVAEPVNELMTVIGRAAVNDYNQNMVKEYRGVWLDLKEASNRVIALLKHIQSTLINISNGNFSDLDGLKKVGQRSENDELIPAFIKMIEAIRKLVDDAGMMAGAAVDGKLSIRVDATRHDGEFCKVIDGFNNTMDAVIGPIKEAAECLQEMANGNMRVRVTGIYKGDHAIIKDALNTTLEALHKIIEEEVMCLQDIANGNLDVAITGNYKGDYSIIKNALNTTINGFNDSLGQISVAIEQVNTGAEQVSDSSQSLAQGAAESASSLEQITASMDAINTQTKNNAENAVQASQLATLARGNAEKGSEKMAQMIRAMNDINESSGNIAKIIKVIDDIAFQTNILALNAAVEAARAGKHGKGFTVVAEEVRTLAQRSAKAAKETAEMIEGSIHKTEVGARIAGETSSSLEEIVRGTAKVTELINEIAFSFKEQATAIEQIDKGLNQVDQVTQQNSASSEELAAASEEMSGQATMVKEMLDKFTLKKQSFAVAPSVKAPQISKLAHLRSVQQQAWSSKHKPVKTGALEIAATRDTGLKPGDIISLDDNEFGNF